MCARGRSKYAACKKVCSVVQKKVMQYIVSKEICSCQESMQCCKKKKNNCSFFKEKYAVLSRKICSRLVGRGKKKKEEKKGGWWGSEMEGHFDLSLLVVHILYSSVS
jgi:hypothetical protein